MQEGGPDDGRDATVRVRPGVLPEPGRWGEDRGGYYLNAAQQGEPDGRWFGKGAEALGLADGQVVTREPYLAVYTMIHPQTGERLPGRAPGGYAKFAQILARKMEAEPHATHERYLQLEREAAQETRRSPVYTDITIAQQERVGPARLVPGAGAASPAGR